jgi:hypothetical protein
MSERLQSIMNSKWAEDNLSQDKIIKTGGSPEELIHTAKKDWIEWQKYKILK